MVLEPARFRLHRSMRKVLQSFIAQADCTIKIDSAFAQVILACASIRRRGTHSTWIVPEMVSAYIDLHRAGLAHSVETWVRGELVGGLYCVALGKAVFGESMFCRKSNASKIALAALVALCRHHGVTQIDCQQNTAHLASLGASEVQRSEFLARVELACAEPPMSWHFDPLYWRELQVTAP